MAAPGKRNPRRSTRHGHSGQGVGMERHLPAVSSTRQQPTWLHHVHFGTVAMSHRGFETPNVLGLRKGLWRGSWQPQHEHEKYSARSPLGIDRPVTIST